MFHSPFAAIRQHADYDFISASFDLFCLLFLCLFSYCAPPFQAHNTLMCFRTQVLYFAQFFCSQAFTNCLQAVFSFSLTSYSILDWARQFLLTALPDFSKIGLSYGNTQVNTQKPWFSAKNALNCIRIWNHTQKYYESKSRQALPDGVFGHFNARKSYPFILL